MKIPSGALTFVVLAVVAIASVLIFRAFAQGSGKSPDNKKFFVKIGRDRNDYVELVDKKQFDDALRTLGDGNYQIRFKPDDRSLEEDPYHPPTVSLKTDKVTTSDLAKNEPPGDPHVTQHLSSDKLEDIKSVLNQLK